MTGTDVDAEVVRAAGGVLWRRRGGDLEVVLVHRPRYDDWSLPKGKADPGETDEEAAVREVEEETGAVGVLGPELRRVTYTDRQGRPKVVRYWAMTQRSGHVHADNEVDRAEWLAIADAGRRLSYDRDRPVLDDAATVLAPILGLEPVALDHVVLVCPDVERSLAWWSGLLGFAGVRVEQWRAGEVPFPSVRIDDSSIIDLLAGDVTGVNMDHVCVTVAGVDLAVLATSGLVDTLEGPGPRSGARGNGTSLYVRSPEGATVELRTYGPVSPARSGDR